MSGFAIEAGVRESRYLSVLVHVRAPSIRSVPNVPKSCIVPFFPEKRTPFAFRRTIANRTVPSHTWRTGSGIVLSRTPRLRLVLLMRTERCSDASAQRSKVRDLAVASNVTARTSVFTRMTDRLRRCLKHRLSSPGSLMRISEGIARCCPGRLRPGRSHSYPLTGNRMRATY